MLRSVTTGQLIEQHKICTKFKAEYNCLGFSPIKIKSQRIHKLPA